MSGRHQLVEPGAAALPTSREGRIVGVDAARGLALVGMFATHILPLRDEGTGALTVTGLVADGRASALFAVLAGVGIALGTGGPRRPVDGRTHLATAVSLLVRGLLVALIGLWLVGLDSPVAVILPYYGLLFAVATPLLRLPAAVLGAGAVVAGALAPVLSMVLRAGGPRGPGRQPDLAALADPGALLGTLALTGYYPVLTWTTYLLAGMAVGRLDLRRTAVAVGLVVGGAGLAAAAATASALLLGPGGGAAALGAALDQRRYGTTPTGTWWWLAIDSPHSGAPLDLAHTTGTALAVLGVALLVARASRAVVWVPAAAGAIPLTLYTAHVVALSVEPGTREGGAADVRLWAGHVLAAVVVGAVFAVLRRRGPLEAVISWAGRGVRRAVAGPDRARSGRP
ncbi:MAG TPA: heparan-alpha-glucosaminide N-acetyltransferase domain-containing protein [Pseudonocardia sp.]|nr:heparan-alpha-glucosaminide N-acetyltransferase domain-containing protein [Pseudonocardia sp.]